MARLRMIAPALDVIEQSGRFPPDPDIVVVPFSEELGEEATQVLVEAYRSVDDSLDDDDQQIDLFWASEWGPPVRQATFCAVERSSDAIVGLSLLCLLDDLPLVAHLVVAQRARRRSVGAHLLAASARGLIDVGIDTVELAVDAKNRNALRLYARLGFRFDAPGCRHRTVDGRPWIGYSERPAFDALRVAMLQAMPDLDPTPDYIIGLRDTETDRRPVPFGNPSAGHHLPGWILALITGWRSGDATISLSDRDLDTAIELLSPAESAALFEPCDLVAWRSLQGKADRDESVVVRFSGARRVTHGRTV